MSQVIRGSDPEGGPTNPKKKEEPKPVPKPLTQTSGTGTPSSTPSTSGQPNKPLDTGRTGETKK